MKTFFWGGIILFWAKIPPQFLTNHLNLIRKQWKFGSRSLSVVSLFQKSPPPFSNPGNAPGPNNSATVAFSWQKNKDETNQSDLDQTITHWNDRPLRRVFLCFYSAIFQLTSAKFQTFVYNSRTVRSSYIKFWQQLSYMFVPNFEAIGQATLVLEPKNRPASFAWKAVSVKKRLKYGKKYFIWLYVLRYPFIPTNPLSAAMRFFSFFSS